MGQTDILAPVLAASWPIFVRAAIVLLLGGLAVTICHLCLIGLNTRLRERQPPAHMLFTLTWLGAVASLIVFATVVRPPGHTLKTGNLLLSGISFAFSLLAGKSAENAFVFHHDNETFFYGQSNIRQPRHTALKPIEHVFLIFLESADGLAWPFLPSFCSQRNCSDLEPKYNTPDYFTPFFNSLVRDDPEAVLLEGFRTTVALTAKSNLATECGVMAEVREGVKNEAVMKKRLPCLPDLLRAYDPKFKSRKFVVSIYHCADLI